MSILLNLPEDVETKLAAEAARIGAPLPEYASKVLAAAVRDNSSAHLTGAELLAYWRQEEVIGSRPDIVDSQTHARALRQSTEQQRRDSV